MSDLTETQPGAYFRASGTVVNIWRKVVERKTMPDKVLQNFKLEWTERWADPRTGEARQQTSRLKVYDNTASNIQEGDYVFVEGRVVSMPQVSASGHRWEKIVLGCDRVDVLEGST